MFFVLVKHVAIMTLIFAVYLCQLKPFANSDVPSEQKFNMGPLFLKQLIEVPCMCLWYTAAWSV